MGPEEKVGRVRAFGPVRRAGRVGGERQRRRVGGVTGRRVGGGGETADILARKKYKKKIIKKIPIGKKMEKKKRGKDGDDEYPIQCPAAYVAHRQQLPDRLSRPRQSLRRRYNNSPRARSVDQSRTTFRTHILY